jgi:uroporphyrin-III C-methyltransferase/precorrin-2 dehydrogenase/sirohydrochlorin ferrochelatase
VRFITGHLKDNSINLDWPALAQPNQTLVFYMGLKGLQVICRSLIEVGRAESTPAALVEKGTTKDQRLLVGTLATLADIVATEDVHAPTLLIIGDVVNLHKQLQWFGS